MTANNIQTVESKTSYNSASSVSHLVGDLLRLGEAPCLIMAVVSDSRCALMLWARTLTAGFLKVSRHIYIEHNTI